MARKKSGNGWCSVFWKAIWFSLLPTSYLGLFAAVSVFSCLPLKLAVTCGVHPPLKSYGVVVALYLTVVFVFVWRSACVLLKIWRRDRVIDIDLAIGILGAIFGVVIVAWILEAGLTPFK